MILTAELSPQFHLVSKNSFFFLLTSLRELYMSVCGSHWTSSGILVLSYHGVQGLKSYEYKADIHMHMPTHKLKIKINSTIKINKHIYFITIQV